MMGIEVMCKKVGINLDESIQVYLTARKHEMPDLATSVPIL